MEAFMRGYRKAPPPKPTPEKEAMSEREKDPLYAPQVDDMDAWDNIGCLFQWLFFAALMAALVLILLAVVKWAWGTLFS
ncbi:MAG: hypothetical protein AAB290_02965 [Candidatus Eisenbacteria bacterium]